MRRDVVKDNSESLAVFTEQEESSASHLDVISRFPGCAGESGDAVLSGYTHVKIEDACPVIRMRPHRSR